MLYGNVGRHVRQRDPLDFGRYNIEMQAQWKWGLSERGGLQIKNTPTPKSL